MFVGRRIVALSAPQSFTQALHHAVFGLTRVAVFYRESLMHVGNAERPVSTDLFTYRQMHAHVQKRIALALLGCELR